MKMKKIICLAFIFALALPLAFAFGGREQEAASDAVSRATPNMPQGKIVIYTSMYENVIESLRWTMKRQFPNCQIEFVYGGTGGLQSRIAAQEADKKLGCDILMIADPSYSIELKQKGMLHAYRSPAAAHLAFDYDSEGCWYPVRVSNMVLAYNPEKTPKDSVPNSFYDFAHGEGLRGEISVSNPLTSGTTMAALCALADKYGFEYFDALDRREVKIESGAAALAKLETGEYKAVMILEESVLQKKQEEKSALEIIYPADGTIMIPSTVMIVANNWSANQNTRTAEIITEWFLSAEGQKAIVEGWMHSVRKGFAALPYGAAATSDIEANRTSVDWENNPSQRGAIESKFEEYVAARE